MYVPCYSAAEFAYCNGFLNYFRGGGGGGGGGINLGFMENRVQAVSLILPRKGLQG